MKINGYQLREAIKHWVLQADAAAKSFNDSLYAFKGEEKTLPDDVMKSFETAERNAARVEEIQQRYNAVVMCSVQDQQLTLALCVKLVGGAGRREKMWREAAVGKKDRYAYNDGPARERDKDKEYAERLLSAKVCSERSQAAAKFASALRNAIARGNSTDVDVEKLGIKSEEYQALFG